MKKIMISISFLLVLTQCNGAQNLGEPEPRPGPNPINPGIGLPTTSQMNTFSGEEEFANFLQLAFNNQEKSDAENNSVNSIADGDVTMDAEPSSSSSNTNITNNQEAGADEGGLVKNYKNFLIALRQGRLVTVKIGDGNTLQKISQVSLPLNNLDSTVWYDELLVQDDHVIVVGYRYLNKGPYYGATELNFFRLSEDGKLDHQQTYLLESSDYYSWENYASRLVDGKLVLYMPYYFSNFLDDNNNLSIPKILKVEPNGNWVEYRSLFQATDVYKPITKVAFPTLHTILTCDVENIGDLNCQAKVVPANWQHAYYVSPKNAYLWVGEQNYEYCYDDVVDDYVSADIDTYSIGNCNTMNQLRIRFLLSI